MKMRSMLFHASVKFSQIRGLELIFSVNIDLFFSSIHRLTLVILLSRKSEVYDLYCVCTSHMSVPEVKKPQVFFKVTKCCICSRKIYRNSSFASEGSHWFVEVICFKISETLR